MARYHGWLASLSTISLLLTVYAPGAFTQESTTSAESIGVKGAAGDAGASDLPTLEAVKSCLGGTGSAECLDNLFRRSLKDHTTVEILKLIDGWEAADADLRRDCHPVVHSVGRETFRLKGNIHDSFSACDQTCHSGCYHGSVERFLRGDSVYAQTGKHPSQAELKQKANIACDANAPLRLRYQCLHGLGHALMFFSNYDLDRALEACDALNDSWTQNSCYGGVFMENVVSSGSDSKNFSATDYHYPCDRVAARYRSECYGMQTSRMAAMGLSIAQMFGECDKAGDYKEACAASVGRDLSNQARLGQPQLAAQECQLAAGELRVACVRGVIYALIDTTWDGRYALPFCAALSNSGDQEDCVKDSVQYLRTVFEKSNDDIRNECSSNAAAPARCIELAGR